MGHLEYVKNVSQIHWDKISMQNFQHGCRFTKSRKIFVPIQA